MKFVRLGRIVRFRDPGTAYLAHSKYPLQQNLLTPEVLQKLGLRNLAGLTAAALLNNSKRPHGRNQQNHSLYG
jgi:hypothetical protein